MKDQSNFSSNTSIWFLILLVYLSVDIGRIQQLLNFGFIRPGMICILLLLYFIIRERQNFVVVVQVRYMYYFLLLLVVLAPIAENYFWALQTAKFFTFFLIFNLSVLSCVDNIQRLKQLINYLILIFVYISIYAILHNGTGPGGYLGDENDLSLFINFMIPFCYYLFFVNRRIIFKLLYAFGLLAGLAAEVISFSRGGMVGLISVFISIWYFSSRKLISLVLMAGFVLMIFFIGDFVFEKDVYQQEMSTITDTSEGTAQARLNSWKAAWYMFVDMPWGVGGNNFQRHFAKYQPDFFNRNMYGRVAHSLWFTLLAETGVVGVFLFLRLMYFNYKDLKIIKNIKQGQNSDLLYMQNFLKAVFCSFVGYFASGTFLSVLYYPYFWYLTAILITAVRITKNILSKQKGCETSDLRAI